MDPTRANGISHNTIIEKLIYEATSHLMAPIFSSRNAFNPIPWRVSRAIFHNFVECFLNVSTVVNDRILISLAKLTYATKWKRSLLKVPWILI